MLTFDRGQVGMNSCDVIMLLYIESVEMVLIKFIPLILPWRQTGTCQSVCDRKKLINCSVVCCSKLAISRIYMLVLFLFVLIVKEGYALACPISTLIVIIYIGLNRERHLLRMKEDLQKVFAAKQK